MNLTRQTEIAISILISCTRTGGLVDTQHVADEAHATREHAAQIIKTMVRAGWIKTRRGRGGGLVLALEPDNLMLGEIVRTMQPAHFGACPARSERMDRSLVSVLSQVSIVLHDLLDCYSIADLAEKCPVGTQAGKAGFNLAISRHAGQGSREIHF